MPRPSPPTGRRNPWEERIEREPPVCRCGLSSEPSTGCFGAGGHCGDQGPWVGSDRVARPRRILSTISSRAGLWDCTRSLSGLDLLLQLLLASECDPSGEIRFRQHLAPAPPSRRVLHRRTGTLPGAGWYQTPGPSYLYPPFRESKVEPLCSASERKNGIYGTFGVQWALHARIRGFGSRSPLRRAGFLWGGICAQAEALPELETPDRGSAVTLPLGFRLLGCSPLSRFPGRELTVPTLGSPPSAPLPGTRAATLRGEAARRQAGRTGSGQDASHPRPGPPSSPAPARAPVGAARGPCDRPRSTQHAAIATRGRPGRRSMRLCLGRPHPRGRSRVGKSQRGGAGRAG